MSDFATFTLVGTVVQEPEELSSFSSGQKLEAVKFVVQVHRPARDGKQDVSEEMEVSAWYAVRAQVDGLRRGQAVLVHGNVSASRGQRGGTFYSLRATAVRALNGFGQQQEQRERMREYQQQQGAANNGGTYQRGRADVPPTGSAPEELGYGSTSRGYMGDTTAQTEQLQDEDIPF